MQFSLINGVLGRSKEAFNTFHVPRLRTVQVPPLARTNSGDRTSGTCGRLSSLQFVTERFFSSLFGLVARNRGKF
jgi:hypothetical protein